jgi:hypothetical protein
MLTTFYPPFHFGGDAMGIIRLSRALVRRGHRVTVIHDGDAYVTLSGNRNPEAGNGNDGVEVVTLRSRLGAVSNLLTQQLGRPVLHGARIRRELAERRVDVTVFHNVSLVGGPGLLAMGRGVTLYMAHEPGDNVCAACCTTAGRPSCGATPATWSGSCRTWTRSWR